MAYVPGTNKPILLIPAVGAGPAVWYFSHTDAHATVAGSGYFSDGADFGLKANDIMIVVDTNAGTATLHRATGATTVAAATLS